MKNIQIIILFLVAIMATSCDSKRFYEKNDAIENDTWSLKNAKVHQFEISDSMQWYNMYVNIRNTADYNYRNLFLFVTTTFPKGQIAKDTLECVLANNQGDWLGKGNGKYKDCRIVFKPKFRFSQQGNYSIKIEHGMRDQDVFGISEVGIRLEYN